MSGFFKTDVVELARGVDYEVKVYYAGDDTYVGSLATYTFRVEKPAPAPIPAPAIPIEWLVIAGGVVLAIIVALLVARAITKAVLEHRREYWVRG